MGPGGEECAMIPPPQTTDDCMVDVTYTYTITNTGAEVMSLVDLKSTQNGVETSLDLGGKTELQPGESITVTEVVAIDLCVGTPNLTTVTVTGQPPMGQICTGTDTYEFTPGTKAPSTPSPVTPAPVTPPPVQIKTNAPTVPPTPPPTPAPVSSSPTPCVDGESINTCVCNNGEEINVSFQICNPQPEDWVGIYPCLPENTTTYNYHPTIWLWTCYSAPCSDGNLAFQNDLTFNSTLPSYTNYGPHTWPLPPGCYVTILNRNYGLSPPPYDIVIEGEPFYIV